MFTLVLEIVPLITLSYVLCENTKTLSSIPGTSLKTVAGVTMASTAVAGNKSAQFVNVIKNILRKNNDDYAEPVRINISNPYLSITKPPTTFTVVKLTTTNKEAKRDKFLDKKGNKTSKNDLAFDMKRKLFKSFENRRFNMQTPMKRFSIKRMPISSDMDIQIIPTSPQIHSRNTTKTAFTHLRAIVKKITQRDDYPKYVNKGKVDKFEKFNARKNKNGKGANVISSRALAPRLNLRVSSSKELVLSQIRAKEATRIPTGDQLDMAPGKGGRMHAMRNKNTLCHRSVLIPEGPKYNKRGKIYLQAFSPKPGRDYPQTSEPTFVLPKCCNCCKKSVLGCE